jgi:hypothetical protein
MIPEVVPIPDPDPCAADFRTSGTIMSVERGIR